MDTFELIASQMRYYRNMLMRPCCCPTISLKDLAFVLLQLSLSSHAESLLASLIYLYQMPALTDGPLSKRILLQTPWSPNVAVQDILCSVQTEHGQFLGVKIDLPMGDSWPGNADALHWLYRDKNGLRLWQEIQQRPRAADVSPPEIERVLAHYETQDNRVYYAIKWCHYACPTWELEEDLASHSNLITQYCLDLVRNVVQ